MAPTAGSLCNKFLALLLLIVHVGCFLLTTADHRRRRRPSPPKKATPTPSCLKPHKALTSSYSFLKRIFSSKTCKMAIETARPPTPARTSQEISPPLETPTAGTPQDSDITTAETNQFVHLSNDIFPCTACGEIFPKHQLLEQHQSAKHAVSELADSDSGKNIVRIIFETGWTRKEKSPKIVRILKIHNSPKIVSRFEEYRESVKAKAAARNGAVKRRDERCIADGNELLRFHCATFLCDLGQNGNSSLCGQQFCSICGIIKSGFSHKLDGISTLSSSWRAHVAIPEDIEEEFKFLNVKRAILVCRVIAGRVGSDADEPEKDGEGFHSVVGRSGSGAQSTLDEEELLVFNPRAVLPCFAIVYEI
ncbi:uncharacterized protein LOC111448110 [Cucurbita moschata]|uniref:Uncharacterized protein LOC111448110 n=1 Tax=Cucurbita moschata TaxID=3662 RepID=A0A6J1FRC7_CUCMO|nr:uncharacterized protein LOC111448110 [Cucurbita moschata]